MLSARLQCGARGARPLSIVHHTKAALDQRWSLAWSVRRIRLNRWPQHRSHRFPEPRTHVHSRSCPRRTDSPVSCAARRMDRPPRNGRTRAQHPHSTPDRSSRYRQRLVKPRVPDAPGPHARRSTATSLRRLTLLTIPAATARVGAQRLFLLRARTCPRPGHASMARRDQCLDRCLVSIPARQGRFSRTHLPGPAEKKCYPGRHRSFPG